MTLKFCGGCGLKKDELDFAPSQFQSNRGICKQCKKEYDHTRYLENKDTICKQTREYRINNSDKVKANKRNYYLNNKEVSKRSERKYRLKNKNDPFFKLKHYMSSAISHFLADNNGSKNGYSIWDYLSYTPEQLKEHIENQFQKPGNEWMIWDNYGAYKIKTWNDNDQNTWKWSIDHIIPRSELPFTSMKEENFFKSWGLDNLRPLSAKQNLLDGTRKTRHQKPRSC